MAITNVHFDDYLYVRKNVIISSKSIKPETMNQLLSHYLERTSLRAEEVLSGPNAGNAEPDRIEHVTHVDVRSRHHPDIRPDANKGQNGLLPQGKHQAENKDAQQADHLPRCSFDRYADQWNICQ